MNSCSLLLPRLSGLLRSAAVLLTVAPLTAWAGGNASEPIANLWLAGRDHIARESADRAVATDPSPRHRAWQAFLDQRAGAAVDLFMQAAPSPRSAADAATLAQMQLAARRPADAAATLESALPASGAAALQLALARCEVLRARRQITEAAGLAEQTLSTLPEGSPQALVAALRNQSGLARLALRQPEPVRTAIGGLRHSAPGFPRAGAWADLLEAALRRDTDPAAALDLYARADHLAAELGDRITRLRALQGIGMTAQAAGRLAAGVEAARQSVTVAESLREPVQAAYAANNHGYGLFEIGRPAEGLRLIEEARERFTKLDHQLGMTFTRTGAAILLRHLGRLTEAERLSREALELARRLDHRHSIIEALDNLALARQRQGFGREARAILTAARQLEPDGTSRDALWIELNLARLDYAQGRLEGLDGRLAPLAAGFGKLNLHSEEALALAYDLRAHVRSCRPAEAAAIAERLESLRADRLNAEAIHHRALALAVHHDRPDTIRALAETAEADGFAELALEARLVAAILAGDAPAMQTAGLLAAEQGFRELHIWAEAVRRIPPTTPTAE